MGEVFVITSGKGGVGKTTSTANIGAGLAAADKKTVLIDTDIGLRNLDVVMGLENRIVYHLVDIIEGGCRIKQALIRDRRYPNLFLLPSAQTRDKTSVSPEQMKKLIEQLRDDFDYILIDCPAGIERGFYNAIAGADRAIIVTTPEVSAIRDADRITGLSLDLIGVIPDDENVVVATNQGETLIGSGTASGKAYENICRRIMGEEVPLACYPPRRSFFFRVADYLVHR